MGHNQEVFSTCSFAEAEAWTIQQALSKLNGSTRSGCSCKRQSSTSRASHAYHGITCRLWSIWRDLRDHLYCHRHKVWRGLQLGEEHREVCKQTALSKLRIVFQSLFGRNGGNIIVYSTLEDNDRWLTKCLLLDPESKTVDASDTLQRFWDTHICTHTQTHRIHHQNKKIYTRGDIISGKLRIPDLGSLMSKIRSLKSLVSSPASSGILSSITKFLIIWYFVDSLCRYHKKGSDESPQPESTWLPQGRRQDLSHGGRPSVKELMVSWEMMVGDQSWKPHRPSISGDMI